MLTICEKFFDDLGIRISVNAVINKSKTKCLAFNVPSEPVNILLYDISLRWVKSHIHLGHIINTNESSQHDIIKRKNEFI